MCGVSKRIKKNRIKFDEKQHITRKYRLNPVQRHTGGLRPKRKFLIKTEQSIKPNLVELSG